MRVVGTVRKVANRLGQTLCVLVETHSAMCNVGTMYLYYVHTYLAKVCKME